MVLGTRYKLQDAHFLNLIIDNHDVKHVSQQNLLGLHIDDKLSFTTHIDKLCSAISSKISLLRTLSTYVSIEVQKKFYQGYIQPLIDYGSIIWGGTSLVNLERVLKLQKTGNPHNIKCRLLYSFKRYVRSSKMDANTQAFTL